MSRPRSNPRDRVNTALRLPRPLHAAFVAEARERDVSVNWLITRAMEHYIDALDAMDDKEEAS